MEKIFWAGLAVFLWMGTPSLLAQDLPKLPSGLQEEKEEEPELPSGLFGEEKTEEEKEKLPKSIFSDLPFDFTGFIETRGGYRYRHDRYEKQSSLGEARLQLDLEKQWEGAAFHMVSDFLYDQVTDQNEIRLEKGEGWIDLREANAAFTPVDFLDIKAGRQILTWGTGDLLFINDLFPKDWDSFFIGRDVEYLKAPSDAVKASFFGEAFNIDFVYTPRFDPDRFIDGRRISHWNSNLGRRSGRDLPVRTELPDDWLEEDEFALRLYRTIRGFEVALYGYRGYWKSPAGQSISSGLSTFPKLSVIGASARGNLAKGIGNLECGYYFSEDDSGGSNPLVRNSEIRLLAGYEQEVAEDLTAGIQYYVEFMLDHADYQRSLPAGAKEADEYRHLLTLRLTQRMMDQNLALSLFAFYSPSDADGYARPRVHYKIDDNFAIEAGGNVFMGKKNHTFFGQFERNSNLYAAVRYSF